MNESLALLMESHSQCRQNLKTAVLVHADDQQIQALDKELSDIYDLILQQRPENPQDAKTMVNFLLDQMAHLNKLKLKYEQPEIPVIKTIISQFMPDS